MKIGLDISSLQGAHRMRGIGYTLINFINNIPSELRKKHTLVFYYHTEEGSDPLELLNLEGLDYEVRPLGTPKRITKVLPGKLNLLIRVLNQIISLGEIYFGDSRITNTEGLDAFLQTDQMVSLPKGKGYKKAFIAYDVIPYVLEWEYLWNYKTARSHGLPRQAALRCSGRRWLYIQKLRINSRRADKVIAISETTRQDFIKYVSVPSSKIVTVPLGVNTPKLFEDKAPTMHRYLPSSWGYLKRPFSFDPKVPYLLFVGGADKRRKLDELVTAFNHLRARGNKVSLVLAGDSMQGPSNIATLDIQQALKESSYLDDIIFMGFVNDEQRDWLYKNALAFVFPSKYEGFGLPVLEAFSYGCPVISYLNEATKEVAGEVPFYADGPKGLLESICAILELTLDQRKTKSLAGTSQVKRYSWEQTSIAVLEQIKELVSA